MWSVKQRNNRVVTALFLVILLSPFGQQAQAQYGGGSGTAQAPFQIWTAEQMNAIGANPADWDKYFKLMADIDLSGFDGKNGRPAFNLIGPDPDPETWYYDPYALGFSGVFDGDGYTISHLTITGEAYLGLFCYLDFGAEGSNLGVVDGEVSGMGSMGGVGRWQATHSVALLRGATAPVWSTPWVLPSAALSGTTAEN